jgi:hypothetical protein
MSLENISLNHPTKKTEADPQLNFFLDLKKRTEKISSPEEKEQVQEFINELKNYCQEYTKIEENYHRAWQEIQESTFSDNEEREGALKNWEIWGQSKALKKNVIIDDLNILYRLFQQYGLDCSWHPGFADEEQFQEWILKTSKN